MRKIMFSRAILIFSLLSLFPFYWFRQYPVGYGDVGLWAFFYNSNYAFTSNLYLWNRLDPIHFVTGVNVVILPINAVFTLMSWLGLSYNIQQSLIYSVAMFASMVSMYLLTSKIFDDRPNKELTGVISAIFYVYNPLAMILYWGTADPFIIFAMPFLPILLYFFSLALRERRISFIFSFSVLFSLFSFIFENPVLALPALFILFMFIIERTIFNHLDRKELALFYAKVVAITLSVNAWFIIPFILSINNYVVAASAAENPLSTARSASDSTNLATLFRIFPYRTSSGVWAYTNPAWRFTYDVPIFVFTSAVLFGIAVLSLLINRKNRRVLQLGMLLVLGLFLCNGLNPPFGYAYEFMLENIPYFSAFRVPLRFAPFIIFPAALLFGLGMTNLLERIKQRLMKVITILFVLLVVLAYVFPILNGSIINSPITIRGNVISPYVQVPPYYLGVTNFLNKDSSDYKVLSLPLRPSSYVTFDWQNGYDGPDITSLLYSHETISSSGLGGTDEYYNNMRILAQFENSIQQGNINSSYFYSVINIFAIKYIVIQNDVDISHGNYGGENLIPQEVLSSLLHRFNVTYVASYGKLEVYEVPSNMFLPSIYLATNLILVNGSVFDGIFDVFASPDFSVKNNLVVFSSQLDHTQQNILGQYEDLTAINTRSIEVRSYNGWKIPFNFSSLSDGFVEARYYVGSKYVVRTDGQEAYDTLSFSSPEKCLYTFPSFSQNAWGAYNSTLIYIKTGKTPLTIDNITENGKEITDVVGVWWETGWMGMGTRPITFPIVIPPYQKAIIQLNHLITDNISISSLDTYKLANLSRSQSGPSISYEMINPTKYAITIYNATKPFFLVFDEPYDQGWKLYASDSSVNFNDEGSSGKMGITLGDVHFLFENPVSDAEHFIANGYANAWLINPNEIGQNRNGSFSLTLYFTPQNYFYIGIFVSVLTSSVTVAGYIIAKAYFYFYKRLRIGGGLQSVGYGYQNE